MAYEDESLIAYEKQIILLTNLFPDLEEIPDIKAAALKAMWFLNGGKEQTEDDQVSELRLYSFAKDAGMIFSAFRQTHGIDISNEDMHWWTFLSLFMDLGQNSTFCNIVALRKRVYSGTASKEERRAASDMGDLFEIEQADNHTIEQKENLAGFIERIERSEKNNEIR